MAPNSHTIAPNIHTITPNIHTINRKGPPVLSTVEVVRAGSGGDAGSGGSGSESEHMTSVQSLWENRILSRVMRRLNKVLTVDSRVSVSSPSVLQWRKVPLRAIVWMLRATGWTLRAI
eukprot:2274479-Pyramimonas_sp.AAC.1